MGTEIGSGGVDDTPPAIPGSATAANTWDRRPACSQVGPVILQYLKANFRYSKPLNVT